MTGGRHGARRLLVQALYQHQVGGHGYDELVAQFADVPDFASADTDHFRRVLKSILEDADRLDEQIAHAADRPVAQLDPIERAVLWIGLAELLVCPDVPSAVVIDEAIELAKEFGAEASHKYVNAILDSASGTLRKP